ncbi:uncharacterized protein M437DRAFT_49891 [Aureobasidium melanogenum CBS 110374]|uniref:Uncharacterized protein n=1 Tax=Aureobasidium melanogenum (strain CBS 110374) TaxID=1043003 RepID=A0A074VWZ8_AURM1|nr:uncharacterized protein M437DRAFT_49891 [Aureobasidium melanogenum CBS 110374]KEQ62237.1 hypothetical protein M437DRAFT_49891 [Aureobasidium melanogenum CBS 110374]
MPEVLQHTSQDVRDLELLDSVTGSAAACANISRKLDVTSRTTAACLSGPLSLIVSGFNAMSRSYISLKSLLQRREPVWSQNVLLSIKFTQERCQKIAAELSTILGHYDEWDIVAADGSCSHLNMLSKNLKVLEGHLDLLSEALELVPVLLRKPAEHESPDSIIIPDCPEESWDEEFPAAEWTNYEAAQERYRIAVYAAQEMGKWSANYASSLDTAQETLLSMKERSKELLDYHVSRESFRGQSFPSSVLEELPDMDDDTSTQSTMGIMTPTEDWSDLGSDTTERGRAPAITRHSLQRCGYATASFLRLAEQIESSYNYRSISTPVDTDGLERSCKAFSKLAIHLTDILRAPMPSRERHANDLFVKREVLFPDYHFCIRQSREFLALNNEIEQSFGHLPASSPVDLADIQAIHEAYEGLVVHFIQRLNVPCQNDYPTSVPVPVAGTTPASHSAPEVSMPFMPEEQKEEVHIDKALEMLINSMETTPIERDIMKLVFHWTVLDDCNGFKRADVMKLN